MNDASFDLIFLRTWYLTFITHTLTTLFSSANPVGIYLLKVSVRSSRKRCKICSKLTIKTPERRQWSHSGVFSVKFEHISHLALVVFLLLTLNMYMPTGKDLKNTKRTKAMKRLYYNTQVSCTKETTSQEMMYPPCSHVTDYPISTFSVMIIIALEQLKTSIKYARKVMH